MDDERWMGEALKEAERAYRSGEVPIGAVIVVGDRIIGRGHNLVESLNDPTAHAEMIAITAACEYKKDWRLEDATIYVTLEPCLMCGGAIVLSRMKRLVYGASDLRMGCYCSTSHGVFGEATRNANVGVSGGVLEDECRNLIQNFFKERRSGIKNQHMEGWPSG